MVTYFHCLSLRLHRLKMCLTVVVSRWQMNSSLTTSLPLMLSVTSTRVASIAFWSMRTSLVTTSGKVLLVSPRVPSSTFQSLLAYACAAGTGYDMIRKLMLVGMLVVAGRGSIAQLFLGLVISFVTFSLQVRLSPVRTSRSSVVMRAWICSVLKRVYCLQYRHSEDNLLKAAVECASSESLPCSQHPRSAALAALTPR